MNLINGIVKHFIKERLKNISLYKEQAGEFQQKWFETLIHQAKDTEWGKKYDYDSIKSVQVFKERVPLQDYDSIKPYIKRMMNGEQGVLWPSKMNWFAKSSGTTSDRSKYIPIPKENRNTCHYKGAQDILSLYCEQVPDTNLFSGKGLVIGGSHQVSKINAHTYYGDLSAVLLQNMSTIGQWFRTPKLSVALMEEWERKIELMAQDALAQTITSISGVPTWTIVLIKKLFELTGKDDLSELLPELELYIHGGVSFAPYKEQFDSFCSKPIHYLQTYNASEGFFGIQDILGTNDMLLLTDHGIFYEFLPMEDIDREQPQTVQLDEVETNKNYAIVISSNAGLWRYKVGDTIQFTSTKPYRIQVTGRTKHFINAFGEEVIVDNAEKALAQACRETGAKVSEYTAGPVYFSRSEQGGHEWWIEFEKPPSNIETFKQALDQALQSVNSDYEAKRYKGIALQPPIIKKVASGTFHRWLKSKGKLGGQHKVPRLANHRKYLKELTAFTEKEELQS